MSTLDDAALLQVLRSGLAFDVHDGDVADSDPDKNTITAALPYVMFIGFPDRDQADSLEGPAGAQLVAFQLTAVGRTQEQAKRAGELARGLVNRRHITLPAGERFVRRDDVALPVGKDPIWTRPDGGPLFFAVDRFTVLT